MKGMPIGLSLKSFFYKVFTGLKNPRVRRALLFGVLILVSLFLVKSCFNYVFSTRKAVVIARDATWYPVNFADKAQNILGFSDDLLIEIAKLKDFRINLVLVPPGEGVDALDYGNSDGVLSALTPNVVLSERYLFSDIYFPLGAVLIVDEKSNIKSLNDMEGKYLGVMRGSPVLFNIGKYPPLQVVPYDSQIAMLDDIIRDKIDGGLLNQLVAYSLLTGYYKSTLKIATTPLSGEGLRFITLKSYNLNSFVDEFNAGLKELKDNGTYNQLLKKWDLYDPYIQQFDKSNLK
jgi:polar amino acid transport system substrate-binding protein